MATLLCISIMVEEAPDGGAAGVDAALRQAQAARDGGADLVEFRIDQVFSGSRQEAAGEAAAYEHRQILRLIAESQLPCIITCRPTSEGGHYHGDEAARMTLFERLGTAFGRDEVPPRFLDVEFASFARSAGARAKITLAVEHPEKLRHTSLILSTHDFDARPADLSRRLLKMRQEPAARVLKIAYRARSLRDNIELFEILAHRDRPTIALGMGEFGLMSRILAPKFGGFLTFAGLHAQNTTAPGQPALRELLDLYRFRSIDSRTKVYGVIGYPLSQSLSPHVHNAGFEAIAHNGVYLPLPIAGGEDSPQRTGAFESLKATLGELIDYAPLDFAGASITIPHKENLVRLACEMGWEMDDLSAASGAANTLTIERDESSRSISRIAIANTDGTALLAGLEVELGSTAGKSVALIGAGGVARAAAAALTSAGAHIHIFNRTPARADALAAALRSRQAGSITTHDWDALATAACDVYINCTPLGMVGGPEPGMSPLSATSLAAMPRHAMVVDTVYNPPATPLLRAAAAAGLRTVDGVSMFVRQAAAQFSLWTGKPAPTALFERIVREHLPD